MKSEIVKLGEVGVDSGQLVLCDPAYIGSQFLNPDSKGQADYAHDIYQHKDGKLWQYCNGEISSQENINPFNGSYADVIPEYGKTPNEMIQSGLFMKTELDPTPHIPKGEFSYRGISKITDEPNMGGQLDYKLGHAGVAVAFRSGMGDGTYNVFAEIVDTVNFGKRVKKVWVELITDEELEEMKDEFYLENKFNL